MTVGDAFKQLGDLLTALEANDIEVTGVDTDEVGAGESLGVELRLDIPTDGGESGLSFGRAAGTRDGEQASETLQEGTGAAGGGGAAETTAPSETAEEDGAASGGEPELPGTVSSGATETEDVPADTDDYTCDRPGCDACFESADALRVHRLVDHDQPDEPLHRHEPALEAAYRAYDSFPKMADALGVDVTPQTVRRNMIDGGIHDPASPGTEVGSPAEPEGGDDGTETDDRTRMPGEEEVAPEEDRAVTDGSGASADSGGGATTDRDGGPTAGTEPAPATDDADDDTEGGAGTDSPPETVVEDITASALREAVVEGGSLRAAAERLDRGRAETRELLSELGLLELVHGRVANRPELAERREAFEAWLADHHEQPPEG